MPTQSVLSSFHSSFAPVFTFTQGQLPITNWLQSNTSILHRENRYTKKRINGNILILTVVLCCTHWQTPQFTILYCCPVGCTGEMVKQTDCLALWPQTFHKGMWPWEQTHQTQANRHNWAELSRFQETDKALSWKKTRWESALALDYDKTVRCCLTTYLCTQTPAVKERWYFGCIQFRVPTFLEQYISMIFHVCSLEGF